MTAQDTDELMWHYTDANGLLGMITNRQVWATHFKFLNDSKEGWYLHEPLSEFLENDPKLGNGDRSFVNMMLRPYFGQPITRMTNVPEGNHFLFCGSTSGDELTLWRNYARDAISYAVGLDPLTPLGPIPPEQHAASAPHETYSWRPVEYHSSTTTLPKPYCDRLHNALRQENGGDRIVHVSEELTRLSSRVKNAAFKDERESRIVCVADSTQLWRFRVGAFGITPYIALGTTDSWGDLSTGEDPLPIRAIRLSSNSTEADHLALNALLENHGYRGGADAEEVYDPRGKHVDTIYNEHEPPIQLLQSENSLRH